MKNKKKAVKLAPKDYVNTLIWFLGGFWVEIMLDGNFTYNLGADTCIQSQTSYGSKTSWGTIIPQLHGKIVFQREQVV